MTTQMGIIRRLPFLLLALVATTTFTCSLLPDDTYLRFEMGEEKHELKKIFFGVNKMGRGNQHFLGLGQHPFRALRKKDNATFAFLWQMQFDDLAEIIDETIDLTGTYSGKPMGFCIFSIGEGQSLLAGGSASLEMTVEKIRDGRVDGFFNGYNLTLLSTKAKEVEKVDIKGQFRAKLKQKSK